MKIIPLSKGFGSVVDDADFDYLNQWRWVYSGKSGYAARCTTVNSKKVVLKMHRVIMETPKGLCIDHINGNKLDNRRENLRNCTFSENLMNRKKFKNKTSQFKGVHWKKYRSGNGKWQSCIRVNSKLHNLGLFEDQHTAALMYDFWATFFFPKYAITNFAVLTNTKRY